MSRTALIVVDVQNDFCEGGSLAVTGGTQVASAIADYIAMARYDAIVATMDWHVDPGAHWSDSPDFRDSWPVHCQAETSGAQLRAELTPMLPQLTEIFRKGEHEAAYSGFEGATGTAEKSDERTPLAAWLRAQEITDVDIVGIATDHCVRATALDAAREGFATRVLLGMTAGVAQETTDAALQEMADAGITLTGSPVVG